MITARTAGFCFGVEKAVSTVYALAREAGQQDGTTAEAAGKGKAGNIISAPGAGEPDAGEPFGAGRKTAAPGAGKEERIKDIVTFGPIIHNEVVVDDLKAKGVGVIHSEAELAAHRKGTIVIRSHGVPKDLYDTIQGSGARVVDTTCTFVKRIHEIVEQESAAGAQIVIIGNHGHAEVDGHKGWCADPKGHPAIVVETREEAEALDLPAGTRVCVVAQTTFNGERFEELVQILRDKGLDLVVHNTICNATRERQKEAEEIARKADVMIVIGGRSSSNTAKLYEICKAVCPRTYLIQTVQDLIRLRGQEESRIQEQGAAAKPAGNPSAKGDPVQPRIIGITAGASTPGNIIEEVQSYVRSAGGADF